MQAKTKRAQTNQSLLEGYKAVRAFSEKICENMETEDYVIQSMPDVSPTKWHLAHVSWFFETFILSKANPGYKSLHPQYNFLFNSYYVQVGKRHSRPQRGFLSRPTVEEVYKYREYVDEGMTKFLERADDAKLEEFAPIVEIGLNHEQQHQELMLTDIKHVFSMNPLRPALINRKNGASGKHSAPPMKWISFPEGVYWIGHDGEGFAFDNEFPRHKTFIQPFELASRLVTNGEYIEFIEDGGYKRPELWLSEGWSTVEANGWDAPFYWEEEDGKWLYFTLAGMRDIDLSEPVCHISHYEADAYARWAGARLPTEAEWETAASKLPITGNFAESSNYHPVVLNGKILNGEFQQVFGDVWEWTQSAYLPYPGYKTLPGALGEYNGKFMSNQMVLRGGSCATPESHIRATYRNFFPPSARWQFMGVRLAKDA